MPRTVRRRRQLRPRRRLPKKKVAMKRRLRKTASEYATCKELYTIKGMSSNTPYSDLEQNLGFYGRAQLVAEAYQYFRIKYVKYTFIQRYNTFQANTNESLAFPMPQLYFMLDKTGSLPTGTEITALKQMGAKPHKFTRNITVAWKPGVSFATGNDNNANILNTGTRISPWLMTNKTPESALWAANDTDHKGIYWFMETAGLPGDGTYEYDAEVEVVFEFKRPQSLYDAAPGATPAVNVHTLRKTKTTPNGQVVDVSNNVVS